MATDVEMKETALAVEEKCYPLFELAQLRFSYETNKSPAVLEKIMNFIKEERMGVYYQSMCEKLQMKVDLKLAQELQKEYDTKMKEFADRLADAQENLGDIEVKNALLDKAEYLNRIGDKDKALEAYQEAFNKTVGVGGRMDNVLARLRICLFFDDTEGVDTYIQKAHEELKKGGDWERKNKLKVLEGVYKMMTRDFAGAARLFIDSVATFTATEILSFKDFVVYTVLCSLIGMPRGDIKKSVIGSPEILSVVHERAHVKEFLFSYYECNYFEWTREFVSVIDFLKEDRYFAPHLMKCTRMLRLNAYRQFITSYKSVTIKLMADTFGVTPEFIDQEIYDFISQGRLNCKIDKVAMVIETLDDRQDQKMQQYKEIIKTGDDLLNKMQKLAAAIDR